jgi:RNA polymerase sigma factor (sigma-70 family)
LLLGLLAGDRKTVRIFFEKFGPLVYSVAGSIDVGDRAVAKEELVNEAFLHLFEDDYRRLKAFKFGSRLSTYIYTVVRRHLLGKIRSRPATTVPEEWESVQACFAEDLEWGIAQTEDPEQERMRRESAEERCDWLQKALERLEPVERLQLQYHADGRTTEDLLVLLGYKERSKLDKSKFLILAKVKKEIRRLRMEAQNAR